MAGDVKVVEEKGPKPVQFTNRMVKWIVIVAAVVAVAGWVGGTYNRLVTSRENVDKSWSSVESEYQKRADLVPNLVATVKGAANFEQTTLTQVTEARAKATQVKVDLNDPNSVQQFSAAQGELSSALSRLLVSVEAYPELKATQNFSDLQNQLEGIENRISVARKDYSAAAKDYNVLRGKVPANIVAGVFGFDERKYFEAEAGAETAPTVDFSTPSTN
jgi:LemA protein